VNTAREFGEPINALKFNFRLLDPEKGREAGAQAVTWANFFNSAATADAPDVSTIYPDGGATPATNSGCTIDRGAKRRGAGTWDPTSTADLSCRNLITAQESSDFLEPSLNDAFPPIGFFMDDKTGSMWVTDSKLLSASGLTTATGKVRGIDAVSATIMRSAIVNEWSINKSLDTETSWVVTAPTKAFYVDRSDSVQAAIWAGGARDEAEYAGRELPYPPFDQIFDASIGGQSRNFVKFTLYDHQQKGYECKETFDEEGFGVSPGTPTVTQETCEQYLCYETNVLNFTRDKATKPGGVFPDSKLVAGAGVDFKALRLVENGLHDGIKAGWMKLDLLNGSGANSQPINPTVGLPVKRYPDTTLTGVIQGLPVIGFMIKHREGLGGPKTNYVSIIEHGYMRSSTVPEPGSPITVP